MIFHVCTFQLKQLFPFFNLHFSVNVNVNRNQDFTEDIQTHVNIYSKLNVSRKVSECIIAIGPHCLHREHDNHAQTCAIRTKAVCLKSVQREQ